MLEYEGMNAVVKREAITQLYLLLKLSVNNASLYCLHGE